MYNEENGAEKCIHEVIKVIKKIQFPIKLLVINDASTDKTLTILEKEEKKYKKFLIIESHTTNKGYGGALQTGIKRALKLGFTYAIFMDSDLTNDPRFIANFAKEIPNGYDCIKASRYVKGGKMSEVALTRQIISIIGSIIARNLFRIGIKDCTNGFRMVKLNMLKGIIFRENNFSIILEELYYLKKKKASFKEIPSVLTARKNSPSNFDYKPQILFDYLKYAIRAFFVA